jgi:microcystin-dependent protein
MGTPYIGEIRMVGFNFAPSGWAHCNGQLLPISENEALFTLIGTTYGGDGQNTFALPDLRGRAPMHVGTGLGITHIVGELGGQETVTLTTQQIPSHTHVPQANTGGNPVNDPSGKVLTGWTGAQYINQAPAAAMSPSALDPTGGSQPHENRPPYVTINFIISLFGIFPPQT